MCLITVVIRAQVLLKLENEPVAGIAFDAPAGGRVQTECVVLNTLIDVRTVILFDEAATSNVWANFAALSRSRVAVVLAFQLFRVPRCNAYLLSLVHAVILCAFFNAIKIVQIQKVVAGSRGDALSSTISGIKEAIRALVNACR